VLSRGCVSNQHLTKAQGGKRANQKAKGHRACVEAKRDLAELVEQQHGRHQRCGY